MIKFISCASGSAGRPGCWSRCSEHLLGGVGDVEEAVGVSVAGVNLPHAGGHAGHALLCHQEEQSLSGLQGNLIPERKTKTVGEVDGKQQMILGQRSTREEEREQ